MQPAQGDRAETEHVAYSLLSGILHLAYGAQKKKFIGQVEVMNEFNQAHLCVIDIYCSQN